MVQICDPVVYPALLYMLPINPKKYISPLTPHNLSCCEAPTTDITNSPAEYYKRTKYIIASFDDSIMHCVIEDLPVHLHNYIMC